MKPIKVTITGAAGQINYNLLFRIANGDMFGKTRKVILSLLELPIALDALNGVKMELIDCAFPLLEDVIATSSPEEAFKDTDFALLVGSKPRGAGMERSDLIKENGQIFTGTGQAINQYASKDIRVIVVGNPCNTNCLIAMHNAPNIPKRNFHAMTFLDQNRATAQIALKAQVPVSYVENVLIWGNHSSTQVPDAYNATIKGKAAATVLNDDKYLQNDFIETVAKRGAAIINARGKSSAASAASALINHVQSLLTPTPTNKFFSSCVLSNGNTYGVPDNLIFSFPCQSTGNGDYNIVSNLEINPALKDNFQRTIEELLTEKEIVKDLLK